jgi:hypothetical protein
MIISVHRKEGATSASTAAELFYQAGWDPALVRELTPPVALEDAAVVAPAGSMVAGPELPSFEEWSRERSAAFASAKPADRGVRHPAGR